MQTQEINDKLIEAIKEKMPAGVNMAGMLMDMLCIGREAIYRRLRGDVPFSLSEAALISSKLDIPLDSLTGGGGKNVAVSMFHLDSSDILNAYRSMLESQMRLYERIAEDTESQLHQACNTLTFMTTLRYPEISRFMLFKWLYQKGALRPGALFRDFVMPEEILDLHSRYVRTMWSINFGSCIWDHMIFEYMFNDLRYFHNIGLLKDTDMESVKQEMRLLLDDTENVAVRGVRDNGKEVQLYISNINFDGTYAYAVGKDIKLSIMTICGVNLMPSSDPRLFEHTRGWVESLRKFSTLISQSGEMQRITFFKKQRDSLGTL